jgi:hypothetical protein
MQRDERSSSEPREAQRSLAPRQARAFPPLAGTHALVLAQWSAAIIAAAAGLWLSRGTSFHQLAIGAFGSLICIFVGLSPVAILFRLVSATRPRRGRSNVAATPSSDLFRDDR